MYVLVLPRAVRDHCSLLFDHTLQILSRRHTECVGLDDVDFYAHKSGLVLSVCHGLPHVHVVGRAHRVKKGWLVAALHQIIYTSD